MTARRTPFARSIRSGNLYRAVTMPFRIAAAYAARDRYRQLVIHDARLTRRLSPETLVRIFCEPNRGKFRRPDDLTILLVHNRTGKTLMEQSLDCLGVEYTILRLPPEIPWRHTMRITATLDWLRSGACKTDYVLSVDCDDALMRDDPAKAVALLGDGEMLVSSTTYARYRNMPDVKAAMLKLAPPKLAQARHPRVHLNAGVYVAKRGFLEEYLTAASAFVTGDDLRLDGLTDAEVLARLPDFPRGVGSDQTIMRYLFPTFYPRMKIDYANLLAAR